MTAPTPAPALEPAVGSDRVALWLGITVVLQSTGVSLLTAHLFAAGTVFVIVVVARLVRARWSVARSRG